jgi:phosphoadenosine phosphosulfate reductase
MQDETSLLRCGSLGKMPAGKLGKRADETYPNYHLNQLAGRHVAEADSMKTVRMSEDEIAMANRDLADATPQTILRWAVERYHPRLLMATAFGVEGCCIIHMLAEIEPTVRLINLETGYQFAETLELRETIKFRYGIGVEYIYPETTVAEYETLHDGPLYDKTPNQCCNDRKILPLKKALVGYDAWMSAIRSDQTADRGASKIVQWDAKFGLMKISPLLNWTKKDVWAFVYKNEVPYNKLHDQSYPSIGCWPCTRPVGEGEDERAGRWSGTAKKECGLHVLETPKE